MVGVVQNAKYSSLNEPLEPYLYLPYAQHQAGEMTVIVRVSGDERAMVAPFRRAIDALDPSMPTLQIVTFTEHLRMALFAERTAAAAAAALGRPRAVPVGDRPARRGGVSGRPADARDRDPDGTRGRPR